MLILTSFPLAKILSKNNYLGKISIFIILGIITYQNYKTTYLNITKIYEPFREFVDVIKQEEDAYKKENALVSSSGTGYITYYFLKQQVPLPNNIYLGKLPLIKAVENNQINEREALKEELLEYKKLYIFTVHSDFLPEFWEFINQNFNLEKTNEQLNIKEYLKK